MQNHVLRDAIDKRVDLYLSFYYVPQKWPYFNTDSLSPTKWVQLLYKPYNYYNDGWKGLNQTKCNNNYILQHTKKKHASNHIKGRQHLKLASPNASIIYIETCFGSVCLRVDGCVRAISPNEFRLLASPPMQRKSRLQKQNEAVHTTQKARRPVPCKQPAPGNPEVRSRHAYAAAISRQHIP